MWAKLYMKEILAYRPSLRMTERCNDIYRHYKPNILLKKNFCFLSVLSHFIIYIHFWISDLQSMLKKKSWNNIAFTTFLTFPFLFLQHFEGCALEYSKSFRCSYVSSNSHLWKCDTVCKDCWIFLIKILYTVSVVSEFFQGHWYNFVPS